MDKDFITAVNFFRTLNVEEIKNKRRDLEKISNKEGNGKGTRRGRFAVPDRDRRAAKADVAIAAADYVLAEREGLL